jgi:hypothetical protein
LEGIIGNYILSNTQEQGKSKNHEKFLNKTFLEKTKKNLREESKNREI